MHDLDSLGLLKDMGVYEESFWKIKYLVSGIDSGIARRSI